LLMALMMPMVQMMLFGWMDSNVRHLPTAVADASRSVESRRLIDELRTTGTFDVEYVLSPAAARSAVISSRAQVAVMIPADYHDRLARGEPAQVLVLVDGSESSVAATAVATASGVTLSESIRRLTGGGGASGLRGAQIEARPVVLFNPDSRSANYLIPGLVAV